MPIDRLPFSPRAMPRAFSSAASLSADLAGVLVEGFSRFGQLHAPRQAPEQRRAHFLFEPFDLLTQRRL